MTEWAVGRETYDTEPPWWFRRTSLLTVLLGFPMLFARPFRSWPLFALGIVLPLLFAVPVTRLGATAPG